MNITQLESDYKELSYLADKVREGEGLSEDQLFKISKIMDCPEDYIKDCYEESNFEFMICNEEKKMNELIQESKIEYHREFYNKCNG